MDKTEFISSGILESYVLDQLSPEERAKVEEMAAIYPEVQAELEQIESALNQYATKFSKTPPAHLKASIAAQLDFSDDSIKPEQEARIISMPPAENKMKYMLAASIALFVLSAAYNLFLFSQLKSVQSEVSHLRSEKESFAQDLQLTKNTALHLSEQLAVVTQTDFSRVILQGQAIAPHAKAAVYWNKSTAELFIAVNNLPAVNADQQYQLWALVDGKPIDAGVFSINADGTYDGLQKMKAITSAQAFAVTLEKKGGSPTPTLSTLCVLGNV